jgi:hypothetical protein
VTYTMLQGNFTTFYLFKLEFWGNFAAYNFHKLRYKLLTQSQDFIIILHEDWPISWKVVWIYFNEIICCYKKTHQLAHVFKIIQNCGHVHKADQPLQRMFLAFSWKLYKKIHWYVSTHWYVLYPCENINNFGGPLKLYFK